jgi:hypothetical protein
MGAALDIDGVVVVVGGQANLLEVVRGLGKEII